MKKFTSVNDVSDINQLVQEALELKDKPYSLNHIGKNKTLGLLFLNSSLRTRLSTQKAAMNLGMNVMVINMDKEGWALETQEGVIMNGNNVEHIKEAAAVIGQYCDIIGIRSFPKLLNKEEDYSEVILNSFIKYARVPVISLECATLHPLQSLADLITIQEWKSDTIKPKVVLTWAPHIKALPQAVPNSFSEWMCKADVDFTITHPEGYELCEDFTKGAKIEYDQEKALKNADFIYVKNWSSYSDYGKVIHDGKDWMLNPERLGSSSSKLMHCLPVRRGVELADELLDGTNSLHIQQACNRVYAVQAVLKRMLLNN